MQQEVIRGTDSSGLDLQFEEGLLNRFESFRKANGKSAMIVLKIDKDTRTVGIEEELVDVDLEDFREDLPDTKPKYILYSFEIKRADGRLQVPLVLIYYTPHSAATNLSMLYSSAKNQLGRFFNVNKMIELRNADDLTTEFLVSQLGMR
ncbi:putative Glia maturation factor beta [Blattamonas nauphoetae]|uniref:Glia maturation factor beta n=1 Tax=Blattamonas nauphoetae TaxID=2049346 RepID=A0ABQ9XDJ8_9EUKA|nr:putative Glia maturation factor beta [Blattamonas nauphoetae]